MSVVATTIGGTLAYNYGLFSSKPQQKPQPKPKPKWKWQPRKPKPHPADYTYKLYSIASQEHIDNMIKDYPDFNDIQINGIYKFKFFDKNNTLVTNLSKFRVHPVKDKSEKSDFFNCRVTRIFNDFRYIDGFNELPNLSLQLLDSQSAFYGKNWIEVLNPDHVNIGSHTLSVDGHDLFG